MFVTLLMVHAKSHEWPAHLNPSDHLQNKLNDCGPDQSGLISVLYLTNVLVAKWAQNPTATFQNIVESLCRRV